MGSGESSSAKLICLPCHSTRRTWRTSAVISRPRMFSVMVSPSDRSNASITSTSTDSSGGPA